MTANKEGTTILIQKRTYFGAGTHRIAILKKIPLIVEEKKLGGVFAWGLGEDSEKFSHLKALNDGSLGVFQ